jgi:hypothetical protein
MHKQTNTDEKPSTAKFLRRNTASILDLTQRV